MLLMAAADRVRMPLEERSMYRGDRRTDLHLSLLAQAHGGPTLLLLRNPDAPTGVLRKAGAAVLYRALRVAGHLGYGLALVACALFETETPLHAKAKSGLAKDVRSLTALVALPRAEHARRAALGGGHGSPTNTGPASAATMCVAVPPPESLTCATLTATSRFRAAR